jgi:hypothetical protein
MSLSISKERKLESMYVLRSEPCSIAVDPTISLHYLLLDPNLHAVSVYKKRSYKKQR